MIRAFDGAKPAKFASCGLSELSVCNARNGACEIFRRTERPLAAVLAADVAGYSRLGADEEGTQLFTLSSYSL